jgi:hypothetical protein
VAHDDTTWILGTGEIAARAALTIRLAHPGFISRRLVLRGVEVYVAERVPGKAMTERRVARMSAAEVERRSRWVPPVPVRWLSVRRRRAD